MNKDYIEMCRRSLNLQGCIMSDENSGFYSFFGEIHRHGIPAGETLLVGVNTLKGYTERTSVNPFDLKFVRGEDDIMYLEGGVNFNPTDLSQQLMGIQYNAKHSYDFPHWSPEEHFRQLYKWEPENNAQELAYLTRNGYDNEFVWWIPSLEKLIDIISNYYTDFDILEELIKFRDHCKLGHITDMREIALRMYHYAVRQEVWNGIRWEHVEDDYMGYNSRRNVNSV